MTCARCRDTGVLEITGKNEAILCSCSNGAKMREKNSPKDQKKLDPKK